MTDPKTIPNELGAAQENPLAPLRAELDRMDAQLVGLVAKRLETVQKIVAAKSSRTGAIRDAAREREVLSRAEAEARAQGISGPLIRRIFTEIISHSVSMQATTLSGTGSGETAERVALQGDAWSYDHLAAEQYLGGRGKRGDYVACESMQAAIARVESGDADFAFLPIENTFAGSINQVYDLLRERDVHIVGEETFKIDHCLAAPGDGPLSALERILSHPQVLEQCSDFIDHLPRARATATRDTAQALRTVAESQDPSQAVIAAPGAAEAFGLTILRHGIGNIDVIQCRFVALARAALPIDNRVPCKTSLILVTRHEQGALLQCLQILSDHGVSLTKLESRPQRNRPWEYLFFIDFEGHVEADNVRTALEALRSQSVFLKILGCYPAKATPGEPQKSQLVPGISPIVDPHPVTPSVQSTSGVVAVAGRLSERGSRIPDTVIRVGNLLIGGDGFTLMAGLPSPLGAENIDQAARIVRAHGGHVLLGGLPSANGSTGIGDDRNVRAQLVAAGKTHGIAVAGEVTAPDQVRPASNDLDLLLVGARNMQNFALLRELARIDRPVILERAPSATLDEWLASADFILSHGNGQVLLCERGIRTFESGSRNTLDLSAVVSLRARTHLPILVDPSRGTGQRNHVAPMALAALASLAHGLILAVTTLPLKLDEPDEFASLDESGLAKLVTNLGRLRPVS
ncbi:MAG: prephenate dehydratase domain-containing protein [Deltaproteobacteria bacterium]|nr:prephenate dehydratase domain-containing protein [Deltaproteobacteria bacterium]